MKSNTNSTNADGPEPRLYRHENHRKCIVIDTSIEENCYGNKRCQVRIT